MKLGEAFIKMTYMGHTLSHELFKDQMLHTKALNESCFMFLKNDVHNITQCLEYHSGMLGAQFGFESLCTNL